MIRAEKVAPGEYGPTYVEDWRDSAACREMDFYPFFAAISDDPETPLQEARRVRDAKAICVTCPVRQECRDYAVSIDEKYGVWGGLTYDERCAHKEQKTCRNGHLLTDTYNGRCRACRRERAREYRSKSS